jgi:hypothetical protein
VGLKGHRYYTHNIPYQSADVSANVDSLALEKTAKSVNYAELADMIADTLSERIGLKQEANTARMESENTENKSVDCPECKCGPSPFIQRR